MISCEFTSLIGRYHDGELAAAQRADIESHIPNCAACSSELEQMQAISQSLRAGVAPMRASAEFLDRLQELDVRVEDLTIVRFVRRLTAVAAAILVGATIFWSFHNQRPVTQMAKAVSYPTVDERLIIEPDSAVAMANTDPTPAAVEPQLEQISLDLSGGRP